MTEKLPDLREAESAAEAVFIGEQAPTGGTVVVGREDRGEWIKWEDEPPLDLRAME